MMEEIKRQYSCSDCIFITEEGLCYNGYGYENEVMVVGSDFCCGAHRTQSEEDKDPQCKPV